MVVSLIREPLWGTSLKKSPSCQSLKKLKVQNKKNKKCFLLYDLLSWEDQEGNIFWKVLVSSGKEAKFWQRILGKLNIHKFRTVLLVQPQLHINLATKSVTKILLNTAKTLFFWQNTICSDQKFTPKKKCFTRIISVHPWQIACLSLWSLLLILIKNVDLSNFKLIIN